MGYRLIAAAALASASLFVTGAYAGSPYYDTDGQVQAQPAPRTPIRARGAPMPARVVSPRAAAQYKTENPADMPSVASDGYASPETDREVYEHAEGTMGTPDAGIAAPAKTAALPGTAVLPRMDADGFQHPEAGRSIYSHAAGTMGSPVSSDGPAAPDTHPVYTAALPKMDADGFEHPETGRSLYSHAEGTMGTP